MVNFNNAVPANPSFGAWLILLVVVAALFAWGFVTSSQK